jgi:hypothetical protein
VVKIEEADDVAVVEIAKDVRVRVVRSTISDVVNKTAQPAQAANANTTGAAPGEKAGLMSQLFGKK